MSTAQSVKYRYGVVLLFVGAALAFSLIFHAAVPNSFLIFFLSAVMLAGWFGRTAAGLLAVMVSTILVDYYFIEPYRAFVMEIDELPYFLTFLLSAMVTSWLGSARRSAEELQRAHLDELFEQSPEAILLVDLQDRVLRINKEFTRLFGYTSAEIVGRASIDFIVPKPNRQEAIQFRERLAHGQNVNVEALRVRKDGTYLTVSEVAFPVVADQRTIAYYSIFRDITESKRAIEELQKARAELAHLSRITTMGELASSIAHEVNQPIGAIATNGNAAARWLSQTPPNVGGAEEAVECIVRDANRAAQVIERIRSLLSNHSTPATELDINDVVREVLVLTKYEVTSRGVVVATDLAGDLPIVTGDRVQLQQVLLNLIMNSLDAMSHVNGRPPLLHIRSTKERDSVMVQVEDSGAGLDPQHENSIFDPFFTTKKNGIGMGLTISRSILERHGGKLWAESRKGSGAILKFTLPVAGNS